MIHNFHFSTFTFFFLLPLHSLENSLNSFLPPSWLKSAEQASSCTESFYFARLICPKGLSLCSRCREGWARSRMNGSQLYHGWAMKPLSQVAAAPGQVAFVPAHMHACSLFVPTLSRLCWFPLCLSTTQARCDCTVFQNRPYNHTGIARMVVAHTGDAMYELQPKCVAHTWHCLQAERCHGFYS